MRLIVRYLIRAPYLWVRKNFSFLLAVALVLGVIYYVGQETDRGVRGELHLAALTASNDLQQLFKAYEATGHFTDRRILEYCSTEMAEVVSKWTFASSRVSLQAIGGREAVVYDSNDGIIRGYASVSAIPGALRISRRISRQTLEQPLYIVPRTINDNWTLRTVITVRHYLRAQVKHFLITSFPMSVGMILAVFFVPPLFRRVVTYRHYEGVIDTLLESPPNGATGEEFIVLLPELVRKALDFDFAAAYVLKGQSLELRACDPADGRSMESDFTPSIPRTAHFIEAAAFRRNCTLFIDHLKARPRVAGASQEPRRRRRWMKLLTARTEPIKSNASGVAPYVVVPIVDPQDGSVAGVLAAEKAHGFEKSNATELETLVRLVMLLSDYARATTRVKEIFNRTIRQTRQVALGTVVPVLAHNVQGRLAPVAWIARDLAKRFASIDQSTAEERLKQVELEMEYCIALIDRISVYRKIGVKTDSSRPSEPIDLNDVLKKICAFFEIYCETRQIRLESHFEADFRPCVSIDELDLLQVISNLFINADEAFGDVPSERSDRKIELLVARSLNPAGVEIRISDNGPGVPPHLYERIFEDNFTTKPHGTGTGLPYCRDVIGQTGGTVKLDTDVRRGATFNIHLPTNEVSA